MAISESMLIKRQSLLRSTSLVSLMTFISRLTGFARDMLLAQLFGAEAGMDSFIVAFRIPNFMRRLFAEGAFSQAFVPVLAEYQHTRSTAEIKIFIAHVAGKLIAILSLITAIGIIAAPLIILLFAPGFGEGSLRTVLAVDMLQITFPYLLFISITAMAGAVLNTYGYYGVPAITSVLLNMAMILTALYLSPYCQYPIVGLAWGVLLGGIAQFLFQLPFLQQRKLLVKPSFKGEEKGVKQLLTLMIPALFGVSIAQINLMVDSIFASFLQVGSVSWLYFTDRLTEFPLGVFGVAVATVILPHLSRHHSANNTVQYSKKIDWGMRTILLIGVPASIGLAVFAVPVIACCFAYGKFSLTDLLQTQKSLAALAVGIPAFMLVKILASAFYARKDIKTPVKSGAAAMVVNSGLCALFIWPLAHAGLALASSLASYFQCAVLLYLLNKRKIYDPETGWLKFLISLFIANLIMGVYLYWAAGSVSIWLEKPPLGRFLMLIIHMMAAVIIYLSMLRIGGLRFAHFKDLMQE